MGTSGRSPLGAMAWGPVEGHHWEQWHGDQWKVTTGSNGMGTSGRSPLGAMDNSKRHSMANGLIPHAKIMPRGT